MSRCTGQASKRIVGQPCVPHHMTVAPHEHAPFSPARPDERDFRSRPSRRSAPRPGPRDPPITSPASPGHDGMERIYTLPLSRGLDFHLRDTSRPWKRLTVESSPFKDVERSSCLSPSLTPAPLVPHAPPRSPPPVVPSWVSPEPWASPGSRPAPPAARAAAPIRRDRPPRPVRTIPSVWTAGSSPRSSSTVAPGSPTSTSRRTSSRRSAPR